MKLSFLVTLLSLSGSSTASLAEGGSALMAATHGVALSSMLNLWEEIPNLPPQVHWTVRTRAQRMTDIASLAIAYHIAPNNPLSYAACVLAGRMLLAAALSGIPVSAIPEFRLPVIPVIPGIDWRRQPYRSLSDLGAYLARPRPPLCRIARARLLVSLAIRAWDSSAAGSWPRSVGDLAYVELLDIAVPMLQFALFQNVTLPG